MPLRSRVTIDTINTLVRKAEYAVRGPIVSKSVELSERLREAATGKSDKKLPFDELIACNIGNPQALKQKPVSFTRDVLSLVMNPSLQERTSFPADVLSRANKYINSIPNIGAYSESQGIPVVREEVAEFLHRR